MKKVIFYTLIFGNLFAQNPIIPGFFPDPSICRVGDNYYVANSSFSFFPGVPIHTSTDLINWKLEAYALTTESQLPLQKGGISSGIWAPTLRYNNGTFFMITTNQNISKNFIVYTKDIKSKWSEPIWLDIKGYDPSLTFEDSTCYLTYASGNGDNGIMQAEIDPFTGKFKTQPKLVWKRKGSFGLEGPHLYKINGWYYILVAEGGTGLMHSVSIARSKSAYGPWVDCPSNPILTNKNARWLRIQAVGHADMIQKPDGKWYMVHLAIRNYGGFEDQWSILGRETCILPMEWKEGWPVINKNGLSSLAVEGLQNLIKKDSLYKYFEKFNENSLGLEWNFIRRPQSTISVSGGYLQIQGRSAGLDSLTDLAFIGFRQRHTGMKWKATISYNPKTEKNEGGLTVFMSHNYHYDLFISIRNGRKSLIARRIINDIKWEEKVIELPQNDKITLEIEGNPWAYMFYIHDEKGNKTKIAHMQSDHISIKGAGGFTGMYLGFYATQPDAILKIDETEYQETQKWDW
jgi:alpha-N-arabinofuranosidase